LGPLYPYRRRGYRSENVSDVRTASPIQQDTHRPFLSGRSILATDGDILAVSNLIDGVDWYSLSDLAFLSTTKLPAGTAFYPLSAITYLEDGTSIVLGSAEGSAYILSRDKGVERLEHGGAHLLLYEIFSDWDLRRFTNHTIGGAWNLRPPSYLPTYVRTICKAFAPTTLRKQALIATGTGELNGQAKITIWAWAEKQGTHGISFVAIQRALPVVGSSLAPQFPILL
jgi:hypothetical protein